VVAYRHRKAGLLLGAYRHREVPLQPLAEEEFLP
jgi:hypothetical protein